MKKLALILVLFLFGCSKEFVEPQRGIEGTWLIYTSDEGSIALDEERYMYQMTIIPETETSGIYYFGGDNSKTSSYTYIDGVFTWNTSYKLRFYGYDKFALIVMDRDIPTLIFQRK